MDSQVYNYLRNNIYPILQDLNVGMDKIVASLQFIVPLLRFGVVIGFFALLWFFASKFVQTILYK